LQAVWGIELGTYCSKNEEDEIVSFEHILELDAIFMAMASGHLFLIHVEDVAEVEEVWLLMLLLQHWTCLCAQKYSAVFPDMGNCSSINHKPLAMWQSIRKLTILAALCAGGSCDRWCGLCSMEPRWGGACVGVWARPAASHEQGRHSQTCHTAMQKGAARMLLIKLSFSANTAPK
jgi:hypothetical protein